MMEIIMCKKKPVIWSAIFNDVTETQACEYFDKELAAYCKKQKKSVKVLYKMWIEKKPFIQGKVLEVAFEYIN